MNNDPVLTAESVIGYFNVRFSLASLLLESAKIGIRNSVCAAHGFEFLRAGRAFTYCVTSLNYAYSAMEAHVLVTWATFP